MKISYECSDLIEELETDILEFGDIDMYAFFKKINETMFLVNYDFIEDEAPLKSEELKDRQIVQIMKAKKILEILKKQNSII